MNKYINKRAGLCGKGACTMGGKGACTMDGKGALYLSGVQGRVARAPVSSWCAVVGGKDACRIPWVAGAPCTILMYRRGWQGRLYPLRV